MGGAQSFLGANPIAADSLDFVGREGKVYANGQAFSIKGVNWFGSEAYCGPPNGLNKHNIGWYLDFLQRHRFNAIRLLFNHEHILKNDIVNAPQSERLLFQVRYIDMFRVLSREAAKRGILVMMGCHRITHDAWPGDGLWYGQGYSPARVLESWTALARALCDEWNVFAVDLQNEPHSASWGKSLPTDWNKAAEQIGNHVSKVCPRWMIMVEGVGYTPGAPGGDDPGAGIWWGENLIGTKTAPVQLEHQDKLVYSPHVYGPSVYLQSYFRSPFFPGNMPSVWQQHFGFAKAKTGRPIVIGEFGGNYMGADRVWQDWAIPYIIEQGYGLFYFALNPDSEDTGGLVPSDDWSDPPPSSVEALKLEALARLPSTDVFELCTSCRGVDASSTPFQPPPTIPSPPPPSRSTGQAAAASVVPSQTPVTPLPPRSPSDTHEVPADAPPADAPPVEGTGPALSTSDIVLIVLIAAFGWYMVKRRRPSNTLPVALPDATKPPKKSRKSKSSNGSNPGANGTDDCVLLLEHDEPMPGQSVAAVRAGVDEGSTITVGARIRVHSLRAEPWHNGSEGVVAGHVETPSGPRCNVVCQTKDGRTIGLCLKVANLQRLGPDGASNDEMAMVADQDTVSDVGTSVSAVPVSTI